MIHEQAKGAARISPILRHGYRRCCGEIFCRLRAEPVLLRGAVEMLPEKRRKQAGTVKPHRFRHQRYRQRAVPQKIARACNPKLVLVLLDRFPGPTMENPVHIPQAAAPGRDPGPSPTSPASSPPDGLGGTPPAMHHVRKSPPAPPESSAASPFPATPPADGSTAPSTAAPPTSPDGGFPAAETPSPRKAESRNRALPHGGQSARSPPAHALPRSES